MSFCILGIDFDIHHAYILSYLIKSQFFGPPRGPKTPLWGTGGPLTYKSYDMMCFNEFLYHWDQFWYTSWLHFIIFDKITIFWVPRGPKTPLREPGGPLTYKSHDMICSNEFLYPWDWFWHTTCLYSIIFDKITIFGPPRGPKITLRRAGEPWHTNLISSDH